MLRALAILLAVVQLAMTVFIIVMNNNSQTPSEWAMIAVFIAYPLVGGLALYLAGDAGRRTLLGLYFERKRLEEQQRIDALQKR